MILGQTLDINGNYIAKAKIESLASDPNASVYLGSLSGAMYYNTTSGVYRINNGAEWVNVVKIQGTAGKITVTYAGNPVNATIDLDPNFSNLLTTSYLPLSGGTLSGTMYGTNISANTISANNIYDTTMIGGKVLVSNGKILTESNIDTSALNTLVGISANIQNQLGYLSAIKVDKTTYISAGVGLVGGGYLSANQTISLSPFGTSGNYDIVQTDSYGRVVSGRAQTSADIPQIPATKIGSGNIDNTEFEYLNGVSANIQNQLNNMASTVGLSAYQLKSEKGMSLGYAALDSNSKIYTSSIPDAILGQLHYSGTWNAATNTPTLPSPTTISGNFYIVTVSGTTIPTGLNPNTSASLWPSGSIEWKVGDWIVSDGTYYEKIDNTDAISTWNGRTGAIVPIAGDYNATQITNTPAGSITATNVQLAINELDTNKLDKANLKIIATSGLTGGGFLSASPTIGLLAVGTSGSYYKVNTNTYGQVTSGQTTLTSGDITGNIGASKIGNGDVTNTQLSYLNTTSANVQTQLNLIESNYKDRHPSIVVNNNAATAYFINFATIVLASGVDLTYSRFSWDINGHYSAGYSSYIKKGRFYSTLRRTSSNLLVNSSLIVDDFGTAKLPKFYIATNDNITFDVFIEAESRTGANTHFSIFENEAESNNTNFSISYSNTKYLSASLDTSYTTVLSSTCGGYSLSATSAYSSETANILLGTINANQVGNGTISNTEFSYLDGTSANIQNQLSELSASKLDKNSIYISAGDGLTGGGFLSANPTISLATTGSIGTYYKVNTNAYGQVVSGQSIFTSSDISGNIDATKIGNGDVSNTILSYSNTLTANIQTQLDSKKSITANAIIGNSNSNYAYIKFATILLTSAYTNYNAMFNWDFYGKEINTTQKIQSQVELAIRRNASNVIEYSALYITNFGLTKLPQIIVCTNNNIIFDAYIQTESVSGYNTYFDIYENAKAMYNGTVAYVNNGVSALPGYSTIISAVEAGYSISATSAYYSKILLGTISADQIGSGNISNTEFEYLDGVSANIQTQLSALSASKGNLTSGSNNRVPKYTNTTTLGPSLITDDGTSPKYNGYDIIYSKPLSNGYAYRSTIYGENTWNNLPFTNQWYDALRFCSYTYEYTSGSGYISASGVDYLFDGNNNTTNLILTSGNSTSAIRFTIDAVTSFRGINFYQFFIDNAAGTLNTNIMFEKSIDNSTWTFNSSADISTMNDSVISYVDASLTGNYRYVRITISKKNEGNLKLKGIRGYSNRYQNGNTSIPYIWDYDKTMSTKGDFVISNGTNLYLSGITSDRVLGIDSSKRVIATPTTLTELNYLVGTSANIQNQLSAISANSTKTNTSLSAYVPLSGGNMTGALTAPIVSASHYGSNFISGLSYALVSDPNNNIVELTTITSAELNYLDGVSANIQTQINSLNTISNRHFTSSINISIGAQSILVNHNLGYLRPIVKMYDETSDQEIVATPVYISINQLSIPLTSSQAFSGVILDVFA